MTDGVLSGRGALVTGGGRGIGEAIAVALADAGAQVIVAARTEGDVVRVAERIRERGGQAHALTCDVTDESSVQQLATQAHARMGAVDLLINNAGDAATAPLAKIALVEWNRMLAVNATGTFLCTREFAPAMAKAGFGRIVNIASVAGLAGARYIAHYTAAKHAVIGLTRATAAEFDGTGVTANAVCPGYADTPLTARTVANVQARTGRSAPDALAAVLASAHQRRLVTPDEVADQVVALCEGGQNGQVVVLAGGGTDDVPFEMINPASLGEPKGWTNGVLAPAHGRMLFIAGQAGWESGAAGTPPGFADQFARALDKILTVVRESGGAPQDVARLTLYVTDLASYRADLKRLGALWRDRFGTYYPAMALVEVKGLVDHGAVIEIEATAVLTGTR